MGNNFRLNVYESFVKNSDDNLQAQYIYTDEQHIRFVWFKTTNRGLWYHSCTGTYYIRYGLVQQD